MSTSFTSLIRGAAMSVGLWGASVAPVSAALKQEIPPLRPPQGELVVAKDKPQALWWIIGAASCSFIITLLAWPRRTKTPVIEPSAARASRELKALEQPAPLEVSRILREHLVRVFQLPGQGVTTEEIDVAISGETELSTRIRDFLARCDEAKFAPHPVPSGTDWVAEAITLIEQTQASRRRVEAISAP